jgi:hypothetical protein
VERRAHHRRRLKVSAPLRRGRGALLATSMAWPPRAEEPPAAGLICEYYIRGAHDVAMEAAAPMSTSAGVCFGPYIGRQRTRPRRHVITMHPNRSCGDGTRPAICLWQRTSFSLRFCSKAVEIFWERCRYLTQLKKQFKRLTFWARAAPEAPFPW